MLVQAQRATALARAAVKNAVSSVPHAAIRSVPRGGKPAAKPAFSMESLWRLAAWASTAAMALFVAVIATRSDVGSDRVSGALASLHLASPPSHAGPVPAQLASQAAPSSRGSDLDATTRQLTQAVRALTEDRDRLAARVAMLEHNVDDLTGSISRQTAAKQAAPAGSAGSQAAQAGQIGQANQGPPPSQSNQANQTNQASAPWPSEPAPALTAPDTVVAAVTPVLAPPAGMAAALPPSPLTPDPAAASPAAATAAFGVDLGGGRSAIALRTRWAGIHAAHPQLFEGLEPVAAVRPATKTRPAELRLIVGPVTTPEAAAQLCASLAPFRVFCRPAQFGGDHLALR